ARAMGLQFEVLSAATRARPLSPSLKLSATWRHPHEVWRTSHVRFPDKPRIARRCGCLSIQTSPQHRYTFRELGKFQGRPLPKSGTTPWHSGSLCPTRTSATGATPSPPTAVDI